MSMLRSIRFGTFYYDITANQALENVEQEGVGLILLFSFIIATAESLLFV